jgi:hypothetical protein
MTCAEARDRFSARVDDALGADEREGFETHLRSCAECRREWRRFELTVSLVRGVEPARAPAGFVDRVLAAARPLPGYARLLRGAFVPWPVKLPLEAAAIVLVAGLASLILQSTSEVEHMARLSPPAEVASVPSPSTPPPPARSATPSRGERRDELARLNRAPQKDVATQSSVPESGDKVAQGSGYSAPRVALTRGSADMEARLAADDRAKAEHDIAGLVARLAGAPSGHAAEPGVLDFVVPRESYPALATELAKLGRLRVEREPAEGADPVRIRLHLD